MKFLKWIIPIVILAAGGFFAYQYYSEDEVAKAAAEIETEKVQRMNLSSTVSATGTIQPVNSVEVSSKITARIKEVLVKENDSVTAGQLVATLDGKDFEAKRDQAQFQVTHTSQKLNRTKYLHDIGAKSDQDLEDAQYEYDTARSTLEETESDLAETEILSPIDGVVVGEPKTPGSMAVQGSDNPTVIMRVADLSQKQIKAKVDETDIGAVKVGQNATFTVDAYTNKTFNAKVSKISQTDVTNSWDTDSSSSSSSSSSSASVIYYYVTLDVEDPESDLLPAMTARVEIKTSNKDHALAIPISALKTDSKGSYVVKVTRSSNPNEPPQLENCYVETGIYSDEYVEIVRGLNEGDEISTTYSATANTTSDSSSNSQNQRGNNRPRGMMGGPPPM